MISFIKVIHSVIIIHIPIIRVLCCLIKVIIDGMSLFEVILIPLSLAELPTQVVIY
jgi:hypothetical protein